MITWRQVLPWFLGFLALGLICLWWGLLSVVPTARAIAAAAPVISFRPRDTIILPLAITFFALATNALIVGATMTGGKPAAPRAKQGGTPWIIFMVGVALIGGALAIFAPPLSATIVGSLVARRGYVRCPAPVELRHAPPIMWARADSAALCGRANAQ